MLPKNSKHYIIPTSLDLNLNPELVEDVIGFYFSSLRKTLSNLECHNIQVEGLGLFKAKTKELPKLIIKHEKHLEVIKPETFNQMAMKKEVEEKLKAVKELHDMIMNDKKRKKEFLKKKYGK